MDDDDLLVVGLALLGVGGLFWVVGDARTASWVACVGALVSLRAVWRAR